MAGTPRLEGVRILVVDDNTDHLNIMRDLLAHAGARVDTAHTAQEGFDAFEAAYRKERPWLYAGANKA